MVRHSDRITFRLLSHGLEVRREILLLLVYTTLNLEMVYTISLQVVILTQEMILIFKLPVWVSVLGKQLKWPDDFFSFITSVNYTRYKLKKLSNFRRF